MDFSKYLTSRCANIAEKNHLSEMDSFDKRIVYIRDFIVGVFSCLKCQPNKDIRDNVHFNIAIADLLNQIRVSLFPADLAVWACAF